MKDPTKGRLRKGKKPKDRKLNTRFGNTEIKGILPCKQFGSEAGRTTDYTTFKRQQKTDKYGSKWRGTWSTAR